MRRILDRLKAFESMKWKEIDRTKSCGLMEVSAICKEAKDRLIETNREEFGTLYKLRVDQRGRVWGVRLLDVFHVLWWDPDHGVYPMNIADN